MEDRGFGIELEDRYADAVPKEDFDLDWFQDADSVDFKLNDEPVTKSGGSRMNKKARPGTLTPTGSTSADADLQRLAWYFRLFLDQYNFTPGSEVNTHEYWGSEGKTLQSARGIAVYDTLVKYIRGILCDSLKLEVSDEAMNVSADYVYANEEADIIGITIPSFTRPADLEKDLFIMFYDVSLKMGLDEHGNLKPLDGISTSFNFEGSNNHDVDGTIGLGSRGPQARALAQKRENSLSLVTSLTHDTVRSILDAEYGEVGAYKPSHCKLLQVPLEVTVSLCEFDDIEMKILFPKCTLAVEYDMSGADRIEVTINLATLGSGTVTLENGVEVATDMYVLLRNSQGEMVPGASVTP